MINTSYDTKETREAAKAYAERKLTEKIMNRTHIEDNLQRALNERDMTCDPRRRKVLTDLVKALSHERSKELAKRGIGEVVSTRFGK